MKESRGSERNIHLSGKGVGKLGVRKECKFTGGFGRIKQTYDGLRGEERGK